MPTANWYPGKEPITETKLNPMKKEPKKVPFRHKPPHRNQVTACPICDDKGLVRDMKTDEWRPCAAGSPYHKPKE
jgi:hypothetical protein